MGTGRAVDWGVGAWGAVAGVLIGLLILLGMNLLGGEGRIPAMLPTTSSAPRDAGPADAAEAVRTLADGEAGLGMPDGVSTRGRVRLFLVAAHMAQGEFDKAVAVAEEMDPGTDRDAALQEIAEKVVPRELTTNPALLPKNNPAEREEMIGQLRRLIRLAGRATSRDLQARLLVRAAIVKRGLDRENPAAGRSDERDLDPQALLTHVADMARAIPPDPAKSDGRISVKILLTALLGLLGFTISQMIQPILQASGSVLAYAVSRHVHEALPERLKGIHDGITTTDRSRSVSDHPQEKIST